MKILKIIKNHSKNMEEDDIRDFLYKNMSAEMIRGIEYDDPKTINRVLKLLGIDFRVREIEAPPAIPRQIGPEPYIEST